VLKTQWK